MYYVAVIFEFIFNFNLLSLQMIKYVPHISVVNSGQRKMQYSPPPAPTSSAAFPSLSCSDCAHEDSSLSF